MLKQKIYLLKKINMSYAELDKMFDEYQEDCKKLFAEYQEAQLELFLKKNKLW